MKAQTYAIILTLTLLTVFIIPVNSIDKGRGKDVEQYKKQSLQDSQETDIEIIDEFENVKEICSIFDKCRACSFKEL